MKLKKFQINLITKYCKCDLQLEKYSLSNFCDMVQDNKISKRLTNICIHFIKLIITLMKTINAEEKHFCYDNLLNRCLCE